MFRVWRGGRYVSDWNVKVERRNVKESVGY